VEAILLTALIEKQLLLKPSLDQNVYQKTGTINKLAYLTRNGKKVEFPEGKVVM